jgi:type III secretion protein T
MDDLNDWAVKMTLILPRLLACFTVLPVLNKKIMGGTIVRNGVVISLALFLFPSLLTQNWPTEMSALWVIGIMLKEAFIGLFIGFVASIPFWAIETTGFFIDNQRGATMASSYNLAMSEQTSPVGLLLSQLLITIFFMSAAFLGFIGGIFKSYLSWPVTQFFPSITLDWVQFFYDQFAHLLIMIVLFSAPIVIAMFLAEFALAIASRSAPQLNVFFLAMPIKSGIASFLLVFYVTILVDLFDQELLDLALIPLELDPLFRGGSS